MNEQRPAHPADGPAPTCGGFVRESDGRLRAPQLFAREGLDAGFWRTGMVLLPLLDEAGLDRMAAGFASLEPFDGWDPRRLDDARSTYHCTFLDPDHTYRRRADELVRTLFAELLREELPGYRILSSNFYVKPPGTGRFEIHQNWPTLEHLDIPTLTVWIPLQDTTFRNGTIRVVPGSHRLFPDVAAASSDRFFDDFESELIEKYLEPVEVPAGSALFFDDSLLHWSSDNLSTTPRVSLQIELVPNDARTVLWIRNPEDADEFELWEMDTEFWIEDSIQSVFGRPTHLPFVGRRPNPNRRISVEEFDDMLRHGDEHRRARLVCD